MNATPIGDALGYVVSSDADLRALLDAARASTALGYSPAHHGAFYAMFGCYPNTRKIGTREAVARLTALARVASPDVAAVALARAERLWEATFGD